MLKRTAVKIQVCPKRSTFFKYLETTTGVNSKSRRESKILLDSGWMWRTEPSIVIVNNCVAPWPSHFSQQFAQINSFNPHIHSIIQIPSYAFWDEETEPQKSWIYSVPSLNSANKIRSNRILKEANIQKQEQVEEVIVTILWKPESRRWTRNCTTHPRKPNPTSTMMKDGKVTQLAARNTPKI